MTRPRAIGLACALAVAAVTGPLHADDRAIAASEIFRAAAAAYARREFRAAGLAFEAAHQKAPHGGTMYNAGLAWEAAGEPARAADAYQTALATPGLAGEQDEDARARLARLEATLARVQVEAPRGVRISLAHAERAPAPLTVHVPPGDHEVQADYPGGRVERARVLATAGASSRVRFEPDASPTAAAAPAEAPRDDGSTQRVAGWIAVGGGVVLGATALTLGALGLSARDEFQTAPSDADLRDRAIALRTWTNVAWVAAGLGAGTGVVLLVTAPSAPATAGARARVMLSPAGATVRGSF